MKALQGRSVFLTGHTGFKGSWLALWLNRLGAKVHGYSLAPLKPSLFEEAKVAEGLASHTIADIRDLPQLTAALKKSQAEIVLHLAAQPLVRLSYEQPRETFETNIMGTVNILESVRQVDSVRVCQIITSDKCYENREWVYAYRECDPLGGYDPYSASKGCAEIVTAAYRQSFFHPDKFDKHHVSVASARAGNVIGGGDWAADRIIPDCIRSLERGESILVRNPGAIRPWQLVLEPLSGYLSLAVHQLGHGREFADAFNFGPQPGGNLTVKEIVERVLKAWGEGKYHTPASAGINSGTAHHEATYLKLDIAKAATLLNWRPAYGMNTAVAETVKWYKQRAAGKNFAAHEACLAQISDYERHAGPTL